MPQQHNVVIVVNTAYMFDLLSFWALSRFLVLARPATSKTTYDCHCECCWQRLLPRLSMCLCKIAVLTHTEGSI